MMVRIKHLLKRMFILLEREVITTTVQLHNLTDGHDMLVYCL